jgi:uncharacterized protein
MSDRQATEDTLVDPLTAPFWESLVRGELVAQRCERCGYVRWPPAPLCPECGDAEFRWTRLAPTGVLWSYCVYHRAFGAEFRDDVPYTVGLVELDDGPRWYVRVSADSAELEIGCRMEPQFDGLANGTIPKWRRAGTESDPER